MDLNEVKARLAAGDGEAHPPVSEDVVCAFENAHGVKLPSSYRRFIIEIASGYDGQDATFIPFALASTSITTPLTVGFPYSRAYSKAIRDRLESEADKSPFDVMSAPDLFEQQFQGSPPGCIEIGDFGGETSVLVITGDERGLVWRTGDFDLPETDHLYLLDKNHTPIDFDRWLVHFLDYAGA